MAIDVDVAAIGLKTDLIATGAIMDVLDDKNEPMFYNGDPNLPVQVRVRSVRSEEVKSLNLRLQEQQAALNRGRRVQKAVPNEQFIARQASVGVVELINFGKTPSQKPKPEELYQLFLDVKMEDIASQIWEFMQDDRNFGAATSGKSQREAETPASQT